MTYEEKMAQRFVREKQSHKTSLFDLEDDEPMDGLTHMGKSLPFLGKDDFEETDLLDSEGSESGDESADLLRGIKRVRGEDDAEDEDIKNAEEEPERKKTKQEVYKEIIAKSKLHKAERQAQKEDDEDLREEVSNGTAIVSDLLANYVFFDSLTKNFRLYSLFYFQHPSREVVRPMKQYQKYPTRAGKKWNVTTTFGSGSSLWTAEQSPRIGR
jgi:hypothetical protein